MSTVVPPLWLQSSDSPAEQLLLNTSSQVLEREEDREGGAVPVQEDTAGLGQESLPAPLGLLEAFSWGTQEGAMSRGQGVIGLCHQVRVRDHHGLPARRLHHISCVTERERGQREERGKCGKCLRRETK